MNEKVFIVCINLNSMVATRTFEGGLSNICKSWKKLMERVYLLSVQGSEISSLMMRDRIGPLSSGCDSFIMRTSVDASWKLPISLDAWIMQNL